MRPYAVENRKLTSHGHSLWPIVVFRYSSRNST